MITEFDLAFAMLMSGLVGIIVGIVAHKIFGN
jgi:hypothetical protein